MIQHALIMAGGEGTRFQPISTPGRPKQFLNLFGDLTLIQYTYKRLRRIFNPGNILIATNKKYLPLVKEQLPDADPSAFIGEPLKKNTAPCIALAAWLVAQRDPEAVMCVFPADHYIGKEDYFLSLLKKAIVSARKHKALVTFGILPAWPSTEYGYIKRGRPVGRGKYSLFEVERFVEKPDAARARDYLISGDYLWNSGIFVWRVDVILKEIAVYLPKLHRALSKLAVKNGRIDPAAIDCYFEGAEAISIDYGVLERSKKRLVLEADIEWSDLGTFDALQRIARNGSVKLNEALVAPLISTVDPATCGRQSQKFVDKPWGFEIIWAETGGYVGKLLLIKKSHRLSYQYHEIKEETIYLIEGAMALEYESGGDRRMIRLQAGESFHIPPKMKHRFIGITDCKVMEVSTPYLNDVVRLEDEYGRVS